jgi:hypothetical protein
LALIEGEAGIGKTRLAEARAIAASGGRRRLMEEVTRLEAELRDRD